MKRNSIVLDTNVLISAALSENGIPRQSVLKATQRHDLLFSRETYGELEEKILSAKFDRYVNREKRHLFLNRVVSLSAFVEITGKAQGCRDGKDDKFLETAKTGKAKYLVSGDNDLLSMDRFHDTLIISPAEFIVMEKA